MALPADYSAFCAVPGEFPICKLTESSQLKVRGIHKFLGDALKHFVTADFTYLIQIPATEIENPEAKIKICSLASTNTLGGVLPDGPRLVRTWRALC